MRLSQPGAGSTTVAPPVTWLNPLSIALPPALFRRGPSTALLWRASRRAGLRPSLGERPSSRRSPTAVRLAALDGRRPARGPCSCALVGCAAGHPSCERARALSLGLSLEHGRQGRPRLLLPHKSPRARGPTAARLPSARRCSRRPLARRASTGSRLQVAECPWAKRCPTAVRPPPQSAAACPAGLDRSGATTAAETPSDERCPTAVCPPPQSAAAVPAGLDWGGGRTTAEACGTSAARLPPAHHPSRRPPWQRPSAGAAGGRPPRPHRWSAVRAVSRGGQQPKRS